MDIPGTRKGDTAHKNFSKKTANNPKNEIV